MYPQISESQIYRLNYIIHYITYERKLMEILRAKTKELFKSKLTKEQEQNSKLNLLEIHKARILSAKNRARDDKCLQYQMRVLRQR